ncbi:hypothetical protein OPV22_018464 [Ensete ventricosum]|uniref:Uncharacterized protein n=1 Tax=Ensete ventricosum TaxID=4639 RepID=A0AAV8QQJ8_ENSVE|nr:hypothetical protein OPV22_018464 [Ensete ventricosum]
MGGGGFNKPQRGSRKSIRGSRAGCCHGNLALTNWWPLHYVCMYSWHSGGGKVLVPTPRQAGLSPYTPRLNHGFLSCESSTAGSVSFVPRLEENEAVEVTGMPFGYIQEQCCSRNALACENGGMRTKAPGGEEVRKT